MSEVAQLEVVEAASVLRSPVQSWTLRHHSVYARRAGGAVRRWLCSKLRKTECSVPGIKLDRDSDSGLSRDDSVSQRLTKSS